MTYSSLRRGLAAAGASTLLTAGLAAGLVSAAQAGPPAGHGGGPGGHGHAPAACAQQQIQLTRAQDKLAALQAAHAGRAVKAQQQRVAKAQARLDACLGVAPSSSPSPTGTPTDVLTEVPSPSVTDTTGPTDAPSPSVTDTVAPTDAGSPTA